MADLIIEGHPDTAGKRRVNLTDREQRRIFAWIDLNIPYYGTIETTDPDYQRILGAFEPVIQRLKENPRIEMPGGSPCLTVNRSRKSFLAQQMAVHFWTGCGLGSTTLAPRGIP